MYSKEDDFDNAVINYVDVSTHSTVCVVTFANGFEIVGTYICRRDEINNTILRKEKAYKNAMKLYDRHASKQVY